MKKDKNDTYWEHCDEAFNRDKEKIKSHNFFYFANQPQTQASNYKNRQESWWEGYPATGVNTTKIVKKDKDKVKDLSHVKCYICKQKGHYANKCPAKPKN